LPLLKSVAIVTSYYKISNFLPFIFRVHQTVPNFGQTLGNR